MTNQNTQQHEASRGFSAIAELLVEIPWISRFCVWAWDSLTTLTFELRMRCIKWPVCGSQKTQNKPHVQTFWHYETSVGPRMTMIIYLYIPIVERFQSKITRPVLGQILTVWNKLILTSKRHIMPSWRDFTSFALSRVKIHQQVWPVGESKKNV